MAEMDAVRAYKERGEDNVAEAAGDPYGDKESDEHSNDEDDIHLFGAVHEHKAGGGPRTDEDVSGVGDFGAGQEKGDDHAEQCGGVDQIPLFDKAQVEVRFVGVFAVRIVGMVRFIKGVQSGVCRQRSAEDGLAQIGQDAVTEGGYADGAEIADDENEQKIGGFAMQLKEGGGDHGAEDDMQGVEDGEEAEGIFFADVLEQEHKEDAEDRSEEGKGAMCPKFQSDEFQSLCQRHLRVAFKFKRYSICNSVAKTE